MNKMKIDNITIGQLRAYCKTKKVCTDCQLNSACSHYDWLRVPSEWKDSICSREIEIKIK